MRRLAQLVLAAFAALAVAESRGEDESAPTQTVEGVVISDDFTHRIVYVQRPDGEIQRLTYRKGAKGPDVGAYVRASGEPRGDQPIKIIDFAAFEELAPAPFWDDESRLVAFICTLAALVLFIAYAVVLRVVLRRRTAALVRETSARLREAVEADAVARERMRLSYDLHDDMQQLLAGTMCRLKAGINYMGRHDEAKALAQFAFARQAVTQTQSSLRHILWGLHNEHEASGSLMGLFTYAAKRFPQWKDVVTFEAEGEEDGDSRWCSGALLMILEEAVGNAIRHGEAKHVRVKVTFGKDDVRLEIEDDGCGFDAEHSVPDVSRLGLASMRLRAEQLGGRLDIVSVKGKGTRITATVPKGST